MKDQQMINDHERRDRTLFNRIAAHYAQKDLNPAGRTARRHRLEQTLRRVPSKKGLGVLEIGCGAGFSALYLGDRIGSYHGIDYAEELITYAQEYNTLPNASFSVQNVKEIGTDIPYDIILMIGVLHHLDDAPGILRRLYHCLKPGGWMIANEPQRSNPLVQGARSVRSLIDSHYSEDQIEYTPDEMRSLYRAAGYEVIDVFPQGVFSTPFAEIMLPMKGLMRILSAAACRADRWLENHFEGLLKYFSWNLIIQGRRGKVAGGR